MTALESGCIGDDGLPEAIRERVSRLDAQGVDTRFHRFMANSPQACDFYWGEFYAGYFANLPGLRREIEVLRLRLAALSGCSFCRAQDVEGARSAGVDDESIDAILAGDVDRLAARDRVVCVLADGLSPLTPMEPFADAFLQELRVEFGDRGLADLLMAGSILAGVGGMLVATGFVPLACERPS